MDMTESVKVGHPRSRGKWLTDKQRAAIGHLVSGKTDEQAAKAAGISRQTLNKWKNSNAMFIAELSEKRAEAWRAFINPLNESVKLAMKTVQNALKENDTRVAMWLLDKLGIDEQLRGEMFAHKASTRSLEDCIEAMARENARQRLKALALDDLDYLSRGETIEKGFYIEELESLKTEYGIDD